MARIGGSWIAAVAAIALLATAVNPRPALAAEQKLALVIGNSAYPSSRLRNPVNDANAMAEKLKSLGFEVILRTDSNLRDMTRAFSQFGQKLLPGSVSLFYYAGHGVQVQGKNFLIPVDAEIESEASVRSEAVDVDQLLHQLSPARLSVVILDACRNNPFERRFRSASGGGLAQIDAPTGTLLAYATAPGKLAADGTGANGLYTAALLNVLDMPGLKVEDVFKQVRIDVVKATDGQQTPWESSSLTGEFYFVPDNKPALADEKLKRSEKERAELAKALEEERKKRDMDAELVKAEMEKLRAELMKIRMEASASKSALATQLAEQEKKRQDERARLEAEQIRREALANAETERKRQEELARIENERRKQEDLARVAAEQKRQDELKRAEAELKRHQALVQIENDRKQQEQLAHAEADLKKQQDLAQVDLERKRQQETARVEEDSKRKEALAQAEAEIKARLALAKTQEDRIWQDAPGKASQVADVTNATGGGGGLPTTQVATITPLSVASATLPTTAGEWKDRVAILEKLRGQLTFSKAMALLLDINTAEDLSVLLTFERRIKSLGWRSAYALGSDGRGLLIWGMAEMAGPPTQDLAVTYCEQGSGGLCKVVMVNGRFRETEFLELAKQLGKQEMSAVRDGYLKSIDKTPTVTSISSPTGAWNMGRAYSSPRD